jgi:exopolysaccharide biosynthesis polyprenyl glycosylphosphotransferase
VLGMGDILVMYSSLLYVLALRVQNFSFAADSPVAFYLVMFLFIHILWLVFLFLLNFYEVPPLKNIYEFCTNLIFFSGLALASGTIVFYFHPKIIIIRVILFLDVLLVTSFILLWRLLFKWFLEIVNFKEKIFVIGYKKELKEISSDILDKNRFDITFYEPQGKMDVSIVNEIIKSKKPDMIVLAFDFYKENGLVKEIFSNFPIDLYYVKFGSFYENVFKKIPLDSIDEVWFLENLKRRGRVFKLTKRIFDIVFSIIGLIITGIIFIPVSLLIAITSPGPILYKQKRVGYKGKEFVIYKFRTMRFGTEEKDPSIASKNESRLTPLGRFLRFTHIDEMPQFYNVLKGNISFVGPRPEWLEFVEVYRKQIPFYDTRHLIKPGLTGWAQIKYHNGATVDEVLGKFKYDLYYIKNYSLILDLAIILRTVSMIIRQDVEKVFSFVRLNILKSRIIAQKGKNKGNGIDILIADDEKIVRELLGKFLDGRGYNTLLASDGIEALNIIKANKVKLAIVDIKMPGALDGLQALRQIKKSQSDVQVIMMTGFGNERTRKVSFDYGAYAYLEKPFDILDIQRDVENALQKEGVLS